MLCFVIKSSRSNQRRLLFFTISRKAGGGGGDVSSLKCDCDNALRVIKEDATTFSLSKGERSSRLITKAYESTAAIIMHSIEVINNMDRTKV